MSTAEEIVKAKAIDKTAGLVTSKGEHYECPISPSEKFWKGAPPPMIPTPKGDVLVGTRRGRVTIAGYFSAKQLLAQCSCGNYLVRNINRWRKGLITNVYEGGCHECSHLDQQKRKSEFLRIGRNTIDQNPSPHPFAAKASEVAANVAEQCVDLAMEHNVDRSIVLDAVIRELQRTREWMAKQ